MSDFEVQWTTPAPLWNTVANLSEATRHFFRQPAILRFTNDAFMDEFLALLHTDPAMLKDFRAQPETWRGPGPAPTADLAFEKLPAFAQQLQRSRLSAHQPSAWGGEPSIHLKTSTAAQPLKLYQPAHQRYYLISAALVCRTAGQPDRHLETSQQERVTFVVRKVVPPADTSIFDCTEDTWAEYAFVGQRWLRVNQARSLEAEEEQQPLFAVNYVPANGRRRRVLAGLIPVGKREAYLGAPERTRDNQLVTDPAFPPPDKRTLLFMAQVTEPWKNLIERAFAWKKMRNPASPLTQDTPLISPALERSIKDNREQMQTTSWYVLLDFAKLLHQYLPNVWETIMNQTVSSQLTPAQSDLVEALAQTSLDEIDDAYVNDLLLPVYPDGTPRAVVPATVVHNLRDALRQIQGGLPYQPATASAIEHNLEVIVTPYDRNPSSGVSAWPNFLFPLADPVQDGPLPPPKVGSVEDSDPLTAAYERIDNLARLIAAALPELTTENAPLPLLATQPVIGIETPTYFVIRCVFERPNCGPRQPTVISDATEPFLLAGFFDPDAPARPIRIGLPVDTTPAGLRKFDKNTAFMISDVLCGQIERAKKLGLGDLVRSVLPFPFHKDLEVADEGPCKDKSDGLALGMICSLSIPIITICALILLIIMVYLLDIIFRWLPYFIMCWPLPKFSGKPAPAAGS